MSELKTLLRQARETKGLSLQEAAGMLGTTKGYLHELESGRSDNPTLRLIAALVIVYGVRPEAMVACALNVPRSTPLLTRRSSPSSSLLCNDKPEKV